MSSTPVNKISRVVKEWYVRHNVELKKWMDCVIAGSALLHIGVGIGAITVGLIENSTDYMQVGFFLTFLGGAVLRASFFEWVH